jgi:4-hydroxy-4-methyl-2-oxoglutarate aldolase
VSDTHAELARLGVATVYEASGRQGLVNTGLLQIVPGSRACGPARTVLCGQDDNLMVHAALDRAQPGEVLVVTMPVARPIGMVGDLLATQMLQRGLAGLLIDAAVRDVEDLRELGLPIWSTWIRAAGATKDVVGELDVPVRVGGTVIAPGDALVLDADGAVVVPPEREAEVLEASRAREEREAAMRKRLRDGELSYDIHGLRAVVEGSG